jgi:hypothetical protein
VEGFGALPQRRFFSEKQIHNSNDGMPFLSVILTLLRKTHATSVSIPVPLQAMSVQPRFVVSTFLKFDLILPETPFIPDVKLPTAQHLLYKP